MARAVSFEAAVEAVLAARRARRAHRILQARDGRATWELYRALLSRRPAIRDEDDRARRRPAGCARRWRAHPDLRPSCGRGAGMGPEAPRGGRTSGQACDYRATGGGKLLGRTSAAGRPHRASRGVADGASCARCAARRPAARGAHRGRVTGLALWASLRRAGRGPTRRSPRAASDG
jgi:hypothetical protein